MSGKLMKTLSVMVCAVLMAQLAGCGTIMYPERKGQIGGRVDAGVALLDGLGLFFFNLIYFGLKRNIFYIMFLSLYTSISTKDFNIKRVLL